MCGLERETLNEWVGNENVGFYHYSAFEALFSYAVTICLFSYLGQSPAAFFFLNSAQLCYAVELL